MTGRPGRRSPAHERRSRPATEDPGQPGSTASRRIEKVRENARRAAVTRGSLIVGARRLERAGMDDLCSACVGANEWAGRQESSLAKSQARRSPDSRRMRRSFGGAVGICGSGLRAEVARCDSLDCVLDSCGEELGAAAELDSAVRRGALAHHDACPRISPQMRLWVPIMPSPHATCEYSWRRPPSLSRLRTRMLSSAGAMWVLPPGGCWLRVRCGRWVL
jgi:hypothetical protein